MRTISYSVLIASLLVFAAMLTFTATPAISAADDDLWAAPAGAGAYRPDPFGPYDYAYKGSRFAPWPGFSATYGSGYYPYGASGVGEGIGAIAPSRGFGAEFGGSE